MAEDIINFFLGQITPSFEFSEAIIWCYQIPREPLSVGVKYTGMGKFRYLTKVAVCLGNRTT